MCDFNWFLYINCKFIFINLLKSKRKKIIKKSNKKFLNIKFFIVFRGGDDYIN